VAGFHHRSDESKRRKVTQNFGRVAPAILANCLLRDGRFGTPKKNFEDFANFNLRAKAKSPPNSFANCQNDTKSKVLRWFFTSSPSEPKSSSMNLQLNCPKRAEQNS
jgi:hypothetical protein